ncbi:MAG: hypothetical protein K1W38_16610 [Lachnospiraceae bacterium]
MNNLYGGWETISEYAVQVLKAAFNAENLTELFIEQAREETLSKQAVLQVQNVERVSESNIDAIIQKALNKKKMT